MHFQWDETKNRINRKKHGIWFEEAESTFDDDHSRLFLDKEHSLNEDRYILIGCSHANRILIVIHCYRESEEIIRIISARKATRKELKTYEEGI